MGWVGWFALAGSSPVGGATFSDLFIPFPSVPRTFYPVSRTYKKAMAFGMAWHEIIPCITGLDRMVFYGATQQQHNTHNSLVYVSHCQSANISFFRCGHLGVISRCVDLDPLRAGRISVTEQ